MVGKDTNQSSPPPIAPPEAPQMVSSVKFHILKKSEYILWTMKIEQYLAHTYYALWKVILNGNGEVQMTKDEAGNEVEVPLVTAQQILARTRERKAKSTLLMAILAEHLARFHEIKDAKTFWAAIKTRFGESTSSTNELNAAYNVSTATGTRDCRTVRNLGNIGRDAGNAGYRGRDNGKRPAREEDKKALVVQDGLGTYDWSYQLEEEATEFSLMAFTSNPSSSSSLNSDVQPCSKQCYQYGLELIEGQLRVHQQNEVIYDEKIGLLEYDVKDKSNLLKYTQKKLNEALREKEDLKAKQEKFETSSKNLTKLLNSQINAKVKTGLGYDSQFNEKEMLDVKEKEVTETVFDNRSSNEENSLANDRFKKVSAVKGNEVTTVKASAGCVWRPRVNEIDQIYKDNRWVSTHGHPQQALKNKGIVNSGCSRHMTGNKAYLADYQEINDGGFVAFGSSRGKITGKGKIRTENSDYAVANLDRKSTTEEYVPAANCYGQVLWIQNQMLDYCFNFMNTKIYIDNESTICIVKNSVYHLKSKHIEIRHHFIRDSYKKKLIQNSANSQTINDEKQIHAILDGKTIIFENLSLMGYEAMVKGKGSGNPPESQPTPSPAHPISESQIPESSSSPQNTQSPRQTLKGTGFPHTRRPNFPDLSVDVKAVYKEGVTVWEKVQVVQSLILDLRVHLYSLVIHLSQQVLDLKKVKTAQAKEIASLKKRVTKLEQRRSSKISSFHPFRAEVITAEPKTPFTTTTLFDDEDVTIGDTLVKMKSQKAKEKGVDFKEANDSARLIRFITTLQPLPTIDPKDKDLDEEVRTERERQVEASKVALAELYDEVQAQIDADHELAARLTHEEQEMFTHAQLKSRSFEEIQKLHTKEQKWVDAFVPIGSKEDKNRVRSRKKRAAGFSSKQKSPKKQKVNDQEFIDSGKKLRKCLKVVPDDDKAINYKTLDVKSLIVDCESQVLGTIDAGDVHVYKLTRLDGSYRHFLTFSRMLEVLDRQDVLDLHKIVMEREDDEIWRNQQDWKLLSWKLYETCVVYTLMLDDSLVSINMFVEKRYPLTKEILKKMLSWRLEAKTKSTLALDLIKFIKLQIEEKLSVWIHPLGDHEAYTKET
nr:ribonuclease H-like domain, reverse transcriptase, RNA-dependent DNA polymerase [Tanacetum cinerariifolium]